LAQRSGLSAGLSSRHSRRRGVSSKAMGSPLNLAELADLSSNIEGTGEAGTADGRRSVDSMWSTTESLHEHEKDEATRATITEALSQHFLFNGIALDVLDGIVRQMFEVTVAPGQGLTLVHYLAQPQPFSRTSSCPPV